MWSLFFCKRKKKKRTELDRQKTDLRKKLRRFLIVWMRYTHSDPHSQRVEWILDPRSQWPYHLCKRQKQKEKKKVVKEIDRLKSSPKTSHLEITYHHNHLVSPTRTHTSNTNTISFDSQFEEAERTNLQRGDRVGIGLQGLNTLERHHIASDVDFPLLLPFARLLAEVMKRGWRVKLLWALCDPPFGWWSVTIEWWTDMYARWPCYDTISSKVLDR